MFCGRKKELDSLAGLYESGKFEFAVVYGRRRVGKTMLLNEFCKGKKTIFFTGIEASVSENLSQLSKAVLEHSDAKESSFDSFEKVLSYLDSLAQNERIVLVIDEYPYLAKSEASFPSLLQKHIDHAWKNSKLMLILCGSSMSFMENQVLGYKNPLYGRKTSQLKILPFSFFESRELCENFVAEEQALLYGALWGVPEYYSHLSNHEDLDGNIVNLMFKPGGRLFEEPLNLLKQEMRAPATYNAVITAIAQGASRLNEISTHAGLETGAASNVLSALMELGIIRREIPATEKNSRKSIYIINDLMYRFWFSFVWENQTNINRGIGDAVYKNFVKGKLNEYMGHVFEEICLQYLYTEKGLAQLPFLPHTMGRWWGTNAKERREEEIDILGLGEKDLLFCECKWTNKLTDVDVLNALIEKSKLLNAKNKHYIFFSKSGYTKKFIQIAKNRDDVALVTFDEMIREG